MAFRVFVLPILLLAVGVSSASPDAATSAWATLQGEGVRLAFEAGSRERAEALLPELEAARLNVAGRLGIQSPASFDVTLAANEAGFRALMGDRFPHWGVGAAFPQRRLIVLMPFRGDHAETLQTARHEVSHVLLFQATQRDGDNEARRVPTWFDEGVAMWVAGEWRLNDSIDVFFGVLSGGLVPLAELDRVLGFPQARAQLAYSQSQMAVTYLMELGGPSAVGEIVRIVRDGEPFDVAIQNVTGLTMVEFEIRLARFVGSRYGLAAMATSSPALWFYASLLILVAYVSVRLRNRARVKAWEEEDPTSALPRHLRPHLTVIRGGQTDGGEDKAIED
jgi:hypothetical protein